jgi:hypothetical protein
MSIRTMMAAQAFALNCHILFNVLLSQCANIGLDTGSAVGADRPEPSDTKQQNNRSLD